MSTPAEKREGDEKERELMIPLNVVPASEKVIDYELLKETQCGYEFCRSSFLQRFATQHTFAVVYGMLGLVFSAAYAYSNGAITTMEKRFKIPSKTIGVIGVGNDISQVFASMILSYYAGKGHRPRWIGLGTLTFVAYCFLTTLPHFMYGPGEDALVLTKEYGTSMNTSAEFVDKASMKKLCVPGMEGAHCEETESNLVTVMILLGANFISGIGGTLFYSVGTAYMDDNVQRDKSPALLSLAFFMRTMGVAVGYALASACLTLYISPTLTPTINRHDPRWMGAWWVGWLVLGCTLTILGLILSLFPNVLPKAAARRAAALERAQSQTPTTQSPNSNGSSPRKEYETAATHASFKDMIVTVKRLLTNRTLMCINGASIFFTFGYLPYWVFMPKYIETQYRQSASFSSLITGTVGLVFSAVGILLTGIVISRYKPTARHMALWNTVIGIMTVLGLISYSFLGCEDTSYKGFGSDQEFTTSFPCNTQCDCEYVPYSPVCSPSGQSFISPCHAGCSSFIRGKDGSKRYTNCSCIPPPNAAPELIANWTLSSPGWENGGDAKSGACPKDCTKVFAMFLFVVCLLKFVGATGRATNFFVSVRCVADKDKPLAMGLGITLMSIFTFVPAPIFFGHLMDTTCLVWGRTCTSKGNCWLYNDKAMRNIINTTSASLVTVSVLFDAAVWFLVKDLQIFDEHETPKEEEPQKDP